MQDPQRYLVRQGIRVNCIVHPKRVAVLDTLHRVTIGHDEFFVADSRARVALVRHPLRYVDELTDPVTLDRFQVTSDAPSARHGGRDYYFRSDSTRRVFLAMPDSFAVRKGM